MFRIQASALDNLLTGSASDVAGLRREVRDAFDQFFHLITGCGQLDHDTDGRQADIYGTSPDTAGVSGDHAILHVQQDNQNAGTTTNPYLYALKVTGPSKFSTTPRGVVRIATATGNWTNNVHPAIPTVAATDDVTGDALTIRLYRTNGAVDPHVRTGYKVPYALDPSGNAVAVCGYVDDKLGVIKLWSGTIANIPAGWRLCDGGSSTPNLTDKFVICAVSDSGGVAKTNVTGSLTVSGGATSHTHTMSGTTASGTASISMSGSTASGTASITMSGSTASGTASISMSGSTASASLSGLNTDYATTAITIGSHTGNTDYATTGIDWTTFTTAAGGDHSHTGATGSGGTGNTGDSATGITFNTANVTGGGATPVLVSVIGGSDSHHHTGPSHTHSISASGTHTHSFTDPEPGSGATKGHRHALPTLTHSVTEPNSGSGHRHALPDLSHTHGAGTLSASDSGHTHAAGTLAATDAGHTHAAGTLAATDAGHTHGIGSIATASADHLPPYYAIAFIQRVS